MRLFGPDDLREPFALVGMAGKFFRRLRGQVKGRQLRFQEIGALLQKEECGAADADQILNAGRHDPDNLVHLRGRRGCQRQLINGFQLADFRNKARVRARQLVDR